MGCNNLKIIIEQARSEDFFRNPPKINEWTKESTLSYFYYHNYNKQQNTVAAGVDKLKPSINGWAQINSRDEISISDKVKLGQEYLVKKSVLFDIEIIIKNSTNVLFSRGVSH